MSGYGYYEFPARITVTAHSAEEAAKEIESLALPDTIAIAKMNAHDLKRPYEYDFFPIQDEEIDSLWTCPNCEESLLENGIKTWQNLSAQQTITFPRGKHDPEWNCFAEYGDDNVLIAMHCAKCDGFLPHDQTYNIGLEINDPLYDVTRTSVVKGD